VFAADVTAFAAENGVADYLPAVLEMTRRVFPDAPITTRVEEDAEIAEIWFILLEVDVAGLDVDQLVAAQQEWSAGLFAHCPPTHAHLFCLGTVCDDAGTRFPAAGSPNDLCPRSGRGHSRLPRFPGCGLGTMPKLNRRWYATGRRVSSKKGAL
jgi:hypothetical protein